jgi:DNA-binding transcriptional ArsR family regulator
MMEQVINDKQLFINVKEASLLLRALNNKFRQQILKLLEQHQRLTVTEILIHLRLLQSITSQHLSILRRQGIVVTRREGKNIYYELNPVRLQEVNHFIESLL